MATTSASWQAASWLRFAGRVVSLQELVQRDGKIANTLTCRVIDGVGNRRRYADEGDLTQPFGSDGVEGEVARRTRPALSAEALHPQRIAFAQPRLDHGRPL